MIRNKIILFALSMVLLSACTDDFESINDNPNRSEDINVGYQFGSILLNYAGGGHEEWRGNLIMTGPLSGVMTCGYRTGQGFGLNDDYATSKWNALFKDGIKNGQDILRTLHEANTDGTLDAKIAQTDILLQFFFQRLTDLYGDIPYKEAGL